MTFQTKESVSSNWESKPLVIKFKVTKERCASLQRHLKGYLLEKTENHCLQCLLLELSFLFLSFQVFPYCLGVRNKSAFEPEVLPVKGI